MSTFQAPRSISDPVLNPGDAPYFAAAERSVLALKRCRACQRTHHYPRALCPFCWSDELDWIDASGTGEIYTFSITRRGVGAPYCIAYVTLAEGPTMLANIVDVDFDTLKIGQSVRVVFVKSEGGVSIPMFTLSKVGE